MQLWALADLVNYSGAMHWPLLLGMKKMPFALVIQIPLAIISIALSIYLVGFTSIGILGVLYATVLTEILRRPFALWYTAKIAKLNVWDYLKRGYGLTALYLLLVSVPGYFVLRNYSVLGWLQFVLAVGLFGVHTLLLLCAIERKLVTHLIEAIRNCVIQSELIENGIR